MVLLRAGFIFALLTCAVACGGGGGSVAPPPSNPGGPGTSSPTPSPTPTPERVYVTDYGTPGFIYAYNLPVSGNSTPAATLQGQGLPGSLGFDPMRRLFVENGFTFQIFAQPISNGEVPSFTLGTSNVARAVAFDASGNAFLTACTLRRFFICTEGEIQVFQAPLSAASTVQFSIVLGHTLPGGVAFDPSGDLWAVLGQQVLKFAPPFSAASMPVLAVPIDVSSVGIAFDSSGNMYLAGNDVELYAAPIASTSTPAFRIPLPGAAQGNSPVNVTNDPNGNLYVTSAAGTLYVFAPPLSANSVPTVTLAIPGAPCCSGVALGP